MTCCQDGRERGLGIEHVGGGQQAAGRSLGFILWQWEVTALMIVHMISRRTYVRKQI